MDLKDGSKVDRVEAREWISWFWHEAVVRENSKSRSTRLAQPKPFVTPIAAVQFPMPAFSQNDAKGGSRISLSFTISLPLTSTLRSTAPEDGSLCTIIAKRWDARPPRNSPGLSFTHISVIACNVCGIVVMSLSNANFCGHRLTMIGLVTLSWA